MQFKLRDQIVWLAGFLEGEGSFMSVYKESWGPYLRISFCSTDKDIVLRACHILRGNFREHTPSYPGAKQQYMGTLTRSAEAAGWMQTLLPLMGERRGEKIKSILKEYF